MRIRDIVRSVFMSGSTCIVGVLLAGVVLASAAFAEDAYVASTGAQAINTGYRVNSKTKIEIDFKIDALNKATEIFGASGSSGTTCCLWINGNGNLEPNFGGWCGGIEGPAKAERRTVVFDMPGKTVKIYAHGGTTPLNTKGSDKVFDKGAADRPLALFANCKDANGSAVENFGTCRIYSFKVWEEGADPIHDWQPAMKGGEVGFVDKVDGSFISEHRLGATPLAIGGDYETLPDEDPYIESDGTTVVNTGVFPDTDLRMELDYALTTTEEKDVRVTGNNVDNGQTIELYVSKDGTKMSFCIGKGWVGGTSMGGLDTRRHTFVADIPKGKAHMISGITTVGTWNLNTTSPIDAKGTVPIALFGRIDKANGASDWAGARAKARIYGVKFYKGTTLVRNLVPCVKGDAAGFRDTVDGSFHTGEFNVSGLSAGGNVERIPDDGYIELAGNDQTKENALKGGHYFDTGYKPGPDTRLEFDYAFSANREPGATGDWFPIVANTSGNGSMFALYETDSKFGVGLGTTEAGGLWQDTGLPAQTNACLVRRTVILDSPNKAVTLLTAGFANYANTNNTFKTADNMGSTLKLGATAGGGGGFTPLRVYGLKIYEAGELKYDYKPEVRNGAPVLVSGSSVIKVTWNASLGRAGMPKAGGDITVSSARDKDAYVLLTGSQSLDTGYKANGKSKFVFDFSFANGYNRNATDTAGEQQFVFETGGGASDGLCGRIYTNGGQGTGSNYAWSYSKNGNWTSTGVTVDHQRRLFTIDAANNQVRMTLNASDGTYNGDSEMASKDKDYTCTKTAKIGSNVAGTGNFAKIRLYRLTIYDDGTKVREYVPAVVDGEAGLYDLEHKDAAPLTAEGLTVSGRGHDGAEEWAVMPQNVNLTKRNGSRTLKAVAIGAQSYKWTKNGEPVSGGENGSVEVVWTKGGATDIYSVTAVYDVFGEEFEGKPVQVSVANEPLGMVVILR